MSLIEGVGNEVVHFVAVLLLAAVGAIAWWSTNARPDRYRIVLAMMRHHTPQQPVSLRIRTAGPRTPETSPQGGGDDVVPLQEMDSMVDADMALLDHNRLRFYRRVDSPRVLLNASESSTDESEVQEDTEPASNVQIREMDSIVSAMEADVTAGIDVFNTPRENITNTAPPLISSVSKDNKESQNTENDQAPIDEPNNEVQVNERKILIKLKYLNDTLKEVEGSLDELLKDFKWRHFSSELSSSRRVRLIYNGRVLIDDGATLRALGLRHRSVVHCLVHPQSGRVEERPSPTGAAEGAGGGEGGAGGAGAGRGERHWDLENILMTLVSIALTIVWFFRCEYSNMFTTSASVALFGLTVFYSVAIFGLYLSDTFHFDRRQPQPIPNN